ncbi:hypothetical protein KHQ88_06165 [Mycoplasmatota bacterium]|nr:hypothetical protein KHQ88_06165 [Mycoplasmatota bacterium]
MKAKLNHKGMSLPAMLAIITFLIGSLLAIITTTINRAELIEKNIESSEEYVNYINNIKAVQKIIERDEMTNEAEISNLVNYFDLNYTPVTPALYKFYKELDSVNRSVAGYLATNTEVIQTNEEIFINTGMEEDFTLSPLINATTMLAEYASSYINEHFPGTILDGDFTTFSGIVNFFETLDGYSVQQPSYITNQTSPTINDYIFIDGDLTLDNKSLTIADDYLLIINGNLYTSGNISISGNFVVNGNFEPLDKGNKTRNIRGTYYINGEVTIEKNSSVGVASRPSFFFINESVTIENQVTIYGYFIASNIDVSSGGTFITGGAYTNGTLNLKDKNIGESDPMSEEDLENYGVSSTVTVESTSGEITFKYTEPKFE